MFLNGHVLSSWMNKKGWDKYFQFYRFSNERNCSKPYPEIFYKTALYHIGDNPITDGYGAESIGIKFIGINGDYGKTLKDAVNQIYKEQHGELAYQLREKEWDEIYGPDEI